MKPEPQYTITSKDLLSGSTTRIEVDAPLVARKAQPGQFVVLRLHEKGERIPLSIADFNRDKGTITLIFQHIGKTTRQLHAMPAGSSILNLAGPLGIPTKIAHYGTVLLVGEGVGFTRLFPIARALKQAGNRIITLMGQQTEDLPFWQGYMSGFSDKLYLCATSLGENGGFSTWLTRTLEQEKRLDHIWVIGSADMMRDVAEATRPHYIPTTASLNTIMLDGFGICGSCRVLINGETRFACVDGPEFDAHSVDWTGLIDRLAFYHREEAEALTAHDCSLDQALRQGAQ